tara:strand:+ start:747 stop:2207 length:1461 start_codon:yes stop_codon:yes gene_type:complete
MQSTEISSNGLKRSYKVIVASNDIEARVEKKLDEFAAQANLPGFRPGKVPVKVLRSRYGKSVFGEVLQEIINETSKETLDKNDVKAAIQPKIDIPEDFKEGKNLEYTLEVEILPDIIPAESKSIKLERLIAKPQDEEIDEAVRQLAQQQKTYHKTKEVVSAQIDDAVVIDFVGSIDGKEFDGGKGKDSQLILGSGQFIPGFEEQLVGSKMEDDVEVKVKFPENYQNNDLKGKDAVFKVKIKEVKQPKTPSIDDDLAKNMGLKNLSELKEKVQDQIQKEYDTVSRSKLKTKLLDELDEMHDFDLPPTLVENEFNSIWRQFEHDKSHNHLDDEDKGKSEEQLKKEYMQIAERRVRLGLLVSKIGELNDIKVEQAEINKAIQSQARQYPGQEKQIFEFYQKNPDASMQLQAPIFEEKVVDFMLELIDVSDHEVSKDILFENPKIKVSNKTKGTTRKNPQKKKVTTKKKQAAKPIKKKTISKKVPKVKKN